MTIRGYLTLGLSFFFGAGIGANLLTLAICSYRAPCPSQQTLVWECLLLLALFLGLVYFRLDGIPREHPHRRRRIVTVGLAGLCLGLLIG